MSDLILMNLTGLSMTKIVLIERKLNDFSDNSIVENNGKVR